MDNFAATAIFIKIAECYDQAGDIHLADVADELAKFAFAAESQKALSREELDYLLGHHDRIPERVKKMWVPRDPHGRPLPGMRVRNPQTGKMDSFLSQETIRQMIEQARQSGQLDNQIMHKLMALSPMHQGFAAPQATPVAQEIEEPEYA